MRRSNHSERAYNHLRRKLLDGSVAPGSRLSYGSIGREIGVSATPVREAVGLLASEGFVELVPQLGAVVRELGSEEIAELYEMREALEPYAAAKAAERIHPTRLAELDEHYQKMRALAEAAGSLGRDEEIDRASIEAFEAEDLAFHMTLIEAAGNARMLKAVGDSHVLSRVFSSDRHRYDGAVLEETCADHERILDALKAADGERARQAMAAHIRNGLARTRQPAPREAQRWWREARNDDTPIT